MQDSIGMGPCPAGHLGPEGPPGPPHLIDLIREWIKEDKILSEHFFFEEYQEGTYISTRCDWTSQIGQHRFPMKGEAWGWSIVLVPSQNNKKRGVVVYYHGLEVLAPGQQNAEAKTRGYLKPEDPLFFTKLRHFLILGHDGLFGETNCKIEWEWEETLQDRTAAAKQTWWESGADL